jgi:hypothetical protein
MKNNREEKYILFNEPNTIEEFTERICDRNHIYNYFGSISMVLDAAFSILKKDITLSFEQCVGGVLFSMTGKEDISKVLNLNQDSSFLNENQLLIKMLTDEINIINNGKTLEMIFYVNGIEPELFAQRRERVNEYFSRSISGIQNANGINDSTKYK